MNGAGFVLCCVIVAMLPCTIGGAEEGRRNGSGLVDDDGEFGSQWIEPVEGLKVNYDSRELIVKYSPRSEKGNYCDFGASIGWGSACRNRAFIGMLGYKEESIAVR